MNLLFALLEKWDRKRKIALLKNHKNCFLKGNIKIGLQNQFILYPNLKRVSIGADFDCRNQVQLLVQNDAELVIEDRVFMNNFCSVNCLMSITIGENTLFGENVKLYDHNHAYQKNPDFKISHSEFTKAPIKIGNNCWLGSNVVVLKGVTIGDNCIIGAGCVIYKDVPANSTVVNHQNLQYQSHL